MFLSQWRKSLFKKFFKKSVLVQIHLTTNISYYDMVIFWTLYIFAEGKSTLGTKALKTIYYIDIKYGIAYFRILKKKFFEKWKNDKSKTLEILVISEILFRVFLFPSFWFCSRAKIENSDLKISEKNFRDFRDFWGFRVFDLVLINFSNF